MPHLEETLKKKTWEGPVRACCPGVDTGKRYSAAEVERLARETEENFD